MGEGQLLSDAPDRDRAGVIAEIVRLHADRADTCAISTAARDRLPSGALRRHSEIRDRTGPHPCRRRPARRLDSDHTRDHTRGGATVRANLEPRGPTTIASIRRRPAGRAVRTRPVRLAQPARRGPQRARRVPRPPDARARTGPEHDDRQRYDDARYCVHHADPHPAGPTPLLAITGAST